VAELIRYRLRHERTIARSGESRIQTRYGEFRMIAYESQVNGGESHIALVRGELCEGCPAFHCGPAAADLPKDVGLTVSGGAETREACERAVLVRVHTRCTAGDLFAADCRCRETLDQSMRMIAEEGCGVLLYLHNTSRGFEIDQPAASAFDPGGIVAPDERDGSGFEVSPVSKSRPGAPQAEPDAIAGRLVLPGAPQAEPDAIAGRLVLHQELRAREGAQDRSGRILRAIGLGGQILSDLGIRRIRLLSNTPMHIPALEGFGLEIVEQVAIPLEKRD
jgi:3,4-dihydroxy 2-butanone 4-phosphate synthase/GTP cyclohydrolase II